MDEIIQILEDHLSSLQAILGTNFVEFIKDDVLKFETNLNMISEIIEVWLLC